MATTSDERDDSDNAEPPGPGGDAEHSGAVHERDPAGADADADEPEPDRVGAETEPSGGAQADVADHSATASDSAGDDADDPAPEPDSSSGDAGPVSGADATPGPIHLSGRIRRWARSARRLSAFFKLLAVISAAALTALLVLAVIATAQAVFDDGYDDGFAYWTDLGPNGRDLIVEGVHHNGPGVPDVVYDRFDASFGRHCDGHGFGDACSRRSGQQRRGKQGQCGFRGWAPGDGKGDVAAERFRGMPGRCGGDSDWGSLDDLHGSFGGRFGLGLAPRRWSGGPGFSEWFEPGPRRWSGPFGPGGPALEFSGDAAPFGLFGGADPFTNPSGALGLFPGIGPEEISDLRGSCEQFRTLFDGWDGDRLGDEPLQIGINELLLGVLCPWPDAPTDGPSADGDHATEDAIADADSENSDADSGVADDG